MVLVERSKSAEITEPGRASEAFLRLKKRLIICLNKTKQPFYNLLQCLESRSICEKIQKKIRKKIRKFNPR